MPAYRSRIGSVQFFPPAPVVDLRVSHGSLELQPISILLVGGAGVRAENRIVYRAERLELENIATDNVAVIGMPIDYAIVGRDLMNRCRIQLDGPALHLTIE